MADRLTGLAQEHFERGSDAMQRGEFRDAVDAFSKAIQIRPDVTAGYRARAAAFRALRDRPSAINDLSEAIRTSPNDAQLRAERAFEHLNQRSYQAAIDDCDAAMQLDPGRSDIYGIRAVAHGNSGNSPMAMLDFEVALRCDPDNAFQYWCARARLNLQLEQFDAAIRDTSLAIGQKESHIPAYELRGMAYSRQGLYAECEADFRKILVNEPKNPAALLGVGLALSEQKKWDEGIIAADAILRQLPNVPIGYELRGMCHENRFEFESAVRDFSKSIEMQPKVALGWHLRAAVYLKMGQWQTAINDHLTAFRCDPDDAEGMNYLAWVWACVPDESLRDSEKAFEFALRSCEKTDFAHPGCLDTLAACHANREEFEKAIHFAEKAVSLATRDPDRAEFVDRLELFRQGLVFRLKPKVIPDACSV